MAAASSIGDTEHDPEILELLQSARFVARAPPPAAPVAEPMAICDFYVPEEVEEKAQPALTRRFQQMLNDARTVPVLATTTGLRVWPILRFARVVFHVEDFDLQLLYSLGLAWILNDEVYTDIRGLVVLLNHTEMVATEQTIIAAKVFFLRQLRDITEAEQRVAQAYPALLQVIRHHDATSLDVPRIMSELRSGTASTASTTSTG